jgi:hypothetical protein
MIIHPYIPKRKPKKPNAKQRAQKASWQALLDKYDIKETKPMVRKSTNVGTSSSSSVIIDPRRSTKHIPSLEFAGGGTPKKEIMQYTGTAMIGIGQLHKSNAVPIFQAEDAVDISKMRRG